MKETIIIHRKPTGFSAEFFGSEAVKMTAMKTQFGTCDIPTPFTTQADPSKVQAAIQAQNPRSNVYLCDCVSE